MRHTIDFVTEPSIDDPNIQNWSVVRQFHQGSNTFCTLEKIRPQQYLQKVKTQSQFVMVLLRTFILSLYGRLDLLEFDPNFWTLQDKMPLMSCIITNGKKILNNQLKLGKSLNVKLGFFILCNFKFKWTNLWHLDMSWKDVVGWFLYHHMVIVNTLKTRMDPTLVISYTHYSLYQSLNISYKDFGIAHGFQNIGLGNEHLQLIWNATNQKWVLTIFQLATIDTR